MKAILFILIFVLLFFLAGWHVNNQHKCAEELAALYGKIAKIERSFWKHGPFWFVGRGEGVFRVEYEDGRIAWIKEGFGEEIKFE